MPFEVGGGGSEIVEKSKGFGIDDLLQFPTTIGRLLASQIPSGNTQLWSGSFHDASAWMNNRATFAGVPGLLVQQHVRLLHMPDDSMRAQGLDFLNQLTKLGPDQQQQWMHYLNGDTANMGMVPGQPVGVGQTPNVLPDLSGFDKTFGLSFDSKGKLISATSTNETGGGDTFASSATMNAIKALFPNAPLAGVVSDQSGFENYTQSLEDTGYQMSETGPGPLKYLVNQGAGIIDSAATSYEQHRSFGSQFAADLTAGIGGVFLPYSAALRAGGNALDLAHMHQAHMAIQGGVGAVEAGMGEVLKPVQNLANKIIPGSDPNKIDLVNNLTTLIMLHGVSEYARGMKTFGNQTVPVAEEHLNLKGSEGYEAQKMARAVLSGRAPDGSKIGVGASVRAWASLPGDAFNRMMGNIAKGTMRIMGKLIDENTAPEEIFKSHGWARTLLSRVQAVQDAAEEHGWTPEEAAQELTAKYQKGSNKGLSYDMAKNLVQLPADEIPKYVRDTLFSQHGDQVKTAVAELKDHRTAHDVMRKAYRIPRVFQKDDWRIAEKAAQESLGYKSSMIPDHLHEDAKSQGLTDPYVWRAPGQTFAGGSGVLYRVADGELPDPTPEGTVINDGHVDPTGVEFYGVDGKWHNLAETPAQADMELSRLKEYALSSRVQALLRVDPQTYFPKSSAMRSVLHSMTDATKGERFARALIGEGTNVRRLGDRLTLQERLYNPASPNAPKMVQGFEHNERVLRTVMERVRVPMDIINKTLAEGRAIETDQDFFEWRERIGERIGEAVQSHGRPVSSEVLRNVTDFSNDAANEKTRSMFRDEHGNFRWTLGKRDPMSGTEAPLPSRPTQFLDASLLPRTMDLIEADSAMRRWAREMKDSGGWDKYIKYGGYETVHSLMRAFTTLFKVPTLAFRTIGMLEKIMLDETLATRQLGPGFKGMILPNGMALGVGGIPIPGTALFRGGAPHIRFMGSVMPDEGYQVIKPNPRYDRFAEPDGEEGRSFLGLISGRVNADDTYTRSALGELDSTDQLRGNKDWTHRHSRALMQWLTAAHSDWFIKDFVRRGMNVDDIFKWLKESDDPNVRQFVDGQLMPVLKKSGLLEDAPQRPMNWDELPKTMPINEVLKAGNPMHGMGGRNRPVMHMGVSVEDYGGGGDQAFHVKMDNTRFENGKYIEGDKELGYVFVEVDRSGTMHHAMKVTSSLVEKDARGKGYGRKMYERAAQEAAKRGYTLLSDEPAAMSESAKQLWDGFVKRGQAEKLDNGRYVMKENATLPAQNFPGDWRSATESRKGIYESVASLRAKMESGGFDPAHPIELEYDPTSGDYVVSNGHHRLMAAEQAGITDVPVDWVGGSKRSSMLQRIDEIRNEEPSLPELPSLTKMDTDPALRTLLGNIKQEILDHTSNGDKELLDSIYTGRLINRKADVRDNYRIIGKHSLHDVSIAYVDAVDRLQTIHDELQTLKRTPETLPTIKALQDARAKAYEDLRFYEQEASFSPGKGRQVYNRKLAGKNIMRIETHSVHLSDELSASSRILARLQSNEIQLPAKMMQSVKYQERWTGQGLPEDIRGLGRSYNQLMYRAFKPVDWAEFHGARKSLYYQMAERNFREMKAAGYDEKTATAVGQARAALYVRNFFHDLSANTSIDRAMRDVFWFLPAWRKLAYRWMVEIPSQQGQGLGQVLLAAKIATLINVLKNPLLFHGGVIQKDKYGNYIVPTPNLIAKGIDTFAYAASGGKLGASPGHVPNMTWSDLLGYSFGLEQPIPAPAPEFQAAIGALAPHAPLFKEISHIINPHGYSASWVPGTFSYGWEMLFGTPPPTARGSMAWQQTQYDNSFDIGMQYAVADLQQQGIKMPNPNDYGTIDPRSGLLELSGAQKQQLTSDLNDYHDKVFSLAKDYTQGIAAVKFAGGFMPSAQYGDQKGRQDYQKFYSKYIVPLGFKTVDGQKVYSPEQLSRLNEYVAEHPYSQAYSITFNSKLPLDISKKDNKLYMENWRKSYAPMQPEDYWNKLMVYTARQTLQGQLNAELGSKMLNNGFYRLTHGSEHAQSVERYYNSFNMFLDSEPGYRQYDTTHRNELAASFGDALTGTLADKVGKTIQDIKSLGSFFTGVQGMQEPEVRRIMAQLVDYYDANSKTFYAPQNNADKMVSWYFTKVMTPYVKQTQALFNQAQTYTEEGRTDLAATVYDQINKIETGLSAQTYNGQKIPSLSEVFYGNLGEVDQEHAREKWAAQPLSWLTEFQASKLGVNITPNDQAFFAYENQLNTQVTTYLSQNGITSGKTYDFYKNYQTNALIQKANELGVQNTYRLENAAPYVRLSMLQGFPKTNSSWVKVTNMVTELQQKLTQDKATPNGKEAVYYKLQWLYPAIEEAMNTDDQFKRMMTSLGIANPLKGEPARGGSLLWEAIFFNHWNPSFIPPELIQAGGN